MSLKFKVHDLLNRKIISFADEGSNVKSNPMPWHNGPTINDIDKLKDNIPIYRVDQVKSLMSRIHENLIGFEFEKLHVD